MIPECVQHGIFKYSEKNITYFILVLLYIYYYYILLWYLISVDNGNLWIIEKKTDKRTWSHFDDGGR